MHHTEPLIDWMMIVTRLRDGTGCRQHMDEYLCDEVWRQRILLSARNIIKSLTFSCR